MRQFNFLVGMIRRVTRADRTELPTGGIVGPRSILEDDASLPTHWHKAIVVLRGRYVFYDV